MADQVFSKEKNIEILILKIACCAVFAGRAWDHFRWSPPFRNLLWDQELMEPLIIKYTKYTWMQYATSAPIVNFIDWIITGFGIFYSLCAAISLTIKSNSNLYRLNKWTLITGSVSLTFLSFLYCKEKFYHIGQFFEYACQVSSPILLIFVVQKPIFNTAKNIFFIKCMIALTFTCHGLYAIGYYPTPGSWIDMVIMSLGISDKQSYQLLYVAGVLDIILSFAIFFPYLCKPALYYAVLWGFITSLARIYGNFYSDAIGLSFQQYLHEVIYRVPHFGIPALAIFMIRQTEKTKTTDMLNKDYTLAS